MVTFDYEQFNKKGLKDVVKWLEKQALPVAEVRGDNKPKRENGFQVKQAEIEFESGQILLVRAKAGTTAFFQAKLNGKVLAIRDYKQLDNELKELAAFVKENEPKYAKNQEKAAAKAKIKVDTPATVATTTSEQAASYQASLAELQGQSEAISNQTVEAQAVVDTKNAQLAEIQAKLDAEKAITAELETAIEKAKSGVFESADCLDEEDCEDEDDEGDEITEGCKKKVTESVDIDKDDPFYCPDCDIAMVTTAEGHRCPVCGIETDGQIVEAAPDQPRDERGRYARRKKSGLWAKIKDIAGKGLSKAKDVASKNKGLLMDIAGAALLGPLYHAGKQVHEKFSGGK